MKIKARFVSAEDNERAVLPAIIYCNEGISGLIGHSISIGWWKWAFMLTVIYIKPQPK